MTPDDARRRFAAARVAHLATADRFGRPHLVPLVFAVANDTIYTAVDHKPKRTNALRRLANIAENPAVALLVDRYDDADWSRLWWVRAEGSALVYAPASADGRRGLELLTARYGQYAAQPPGGSVVAIAVTRWAGWDASEAS